MKLLIAYGSRGKFFHLKEFSDELEKQNVHVKLVRDSDYSKGFPSKKISDWFNGDRKFKELIREFQPDAIFTDRQTHFGLHAIKTGIPTFILLRGHYWQEYFWGMKTLGGNLKTRVAIWFRNRISEKVFQEATAILPICKYLEDVVKEHHPSQNTGVFLEGINSERWHRTKKMELELQNFGAHFNGQYVCPHHPEWENGKRRKSIKLCECRKPGTLLLERAAKEINFSANEAVFIGDSSTDFEAAAKWGTTSVGVLTGNSSRDGDVSFEPDYWKKDLWEAVDFLLESY